MAKVNLAIPPVVNQLCELWKGSAMASMTGNYKAYKQVHKEYASLAMQNQHIIKHTRFPEIKVPLFSKMGLNMIKVSLLDMFRIKTKDERNLAKLLHQEALQQKAARLVSQEPQCKIFI